MSRARSINQEPRQTAAASEDGSGCFSVYWIPPLAAIFIICMLTAFALKVTNNTYALPVNASVLQPKNSALAVSTPDLPIVDNSALVVPTSALAVDVVAKPTQKSTTPFFEFSTSASTGISPIFTKQIQYWANDIVRWSSASSLDPNLVAVIMQIESCGDPHALSRSGAIGLFQVMPFHFHFGENPFNPDTNALRGLEYLSRSLSTASGDARLALAGYNGGIGVISRAEWTWPAETNRYVQYGAPIYEDARSGLSSSNALQEWYGKYGASLCRQASNRLGIAE